MSEEINKEIEYDSLMKPLRDWKWVMILSNGGLFAITIKSIPFIVKKTGINYKNWRSVLSSSIIFSFLWSTFIFGYNYAFMKYILKIKPDEFFEKRRQLEDSMILESKYDFHTLIELIDSEDEKKH
jgi:hypothetical protein